MKKRILCLALALIVLGGCSSRSADSLSGDGGAAAPGAQMTMPATTYAPAVDNISKEYSGVSESYPEAGAAGEVHQYNLTGAQIDSGKLIRTGRYSLESMEYDKTLAALESLVTQLGGYVQNSYTSAGGWQSSAMARYCNYVVRVPAESFATFCKGLETCGTVISSQQNAEEVTDYYYDTEARLGTLRVQEERLLALMGQAAELEAIITLESRLSDVRYQIESCQGTLRRLDSQIAYSTISVDVNEVFEPTKLGNEVISLGERISLRFAATIDGLKRFGGTIAVALIGGSPVILIFVILAVAVILLLRKINKRHEPAPEKKKDEQGGEPKN